MKNLKKLLLGLGSFGVLLMVAGCSIEQDSDVYVIDESDFVNASALIADITVVDLDEDEIAGLVLMREEEKLARDVYTTLGEKWGTKIFTNIAESEQTHTDAVKVLLARYEISDPVLDDTVGIFTSEELGGLYVDLVEQGSESMLEALTVGAIVEDLDIKDLDTLMEQTDKEDILITYENLQRGSRNHLRAYVRQIEINGGSYEPQYISPTDYEEIIVSEEERGGGAGVGAGNRGNK